MQTSAILSRRNVTLGGTAMGTLFAVGLSPLGSSALGQKGNGKSIGKPPQQYFTTDNGAGMRGPWGEVRTVRLAGALYPYWIESADKGGTFSFGGRNWFVRLGTEGSGLTMTSEGFAVGKEKRVSWKGNVARLTSLIRGNKAWTRSAMQLRSTFLSSFVVAAAQAKNAPAIGSFADAFVKVVEDVGEATNCTIRTVTEEITTRVERTVDIITTAEEQYQHCYDQAVAGGCSKLLFGPAIIGCAVLYCGAKTFADVVSGVMRVWDDVVEDVTRDVKQCTKTVRGYLPNRWTLPDLPIPAFEEPGFIREIRQGLIEATQVGKALRLLRDNLNGSLAFLGPFKCLLEGDWSIASLPLVGGIGIPFGVTLTIDANCARSLSVANLAGPAAQAWSGALSLLATFNPGAAAALAAMEIAPITSLLSSVTSLGPAAIAAGSVIACLMILVLYHATLIASQISALLWLNPGVLNDGKLAMTHPSLAAAAVSALALGTLSPVFLVPPIVTG